MGFRGILGHPFIDLEPYLDTSRFEEIDEEISLGLAQVAVEYTGGSHKHMGIVPPSLADEPYVDYGDVIAGFDRDEFARFVSLAERPGDFDVERQHEYSFGEERDVPLTKKQMLWLEYRYGVYFPWKVFYEMIPTKNWDDKSHGVGKEFKPEAALHFPKLIELVRALPFVEVGRCNILGLAANDHGTVHTDRGEEEKPEPDQFITLCPRGDKRLYLWDEQRDERARTRMQDEQKYFIESRAYWFNDSDYHGVEADPFFRYSVRVDGFFDPEFLARVAAGAGGR